MGKPAATISHFHVCPKTTGQVPHVGGPVIQGSTDVFIGGLPAARVGDALICVGPPDKIKEGSASVFIDGKPAARLGDGTDHGGVIVVGNPTVIIGDHCPPSTPRGPNGVFVDAGRYFGNGGDTVAALQVNKAYALCGTPHYPQ